MTGLHSSLPAIVWFKPRTQTAQAQLLERVEQDNEVRIWATHPAVGLPFQIVCRTSSSFPTHVFMAFRDGTALGEEEIAGPQAGEDVMERLQSMVDSLAEMHQITERDMQGQSVLKALPWFVATKVAIGDKIYG